MSAELAENMSQCLRFSLSAFLLFALRDIFGYGTITLPARDSLLSFNLPVSAELMQAGGFIASIPGTLVLVGLLVVFQNHIMRKFRIAANFFARNSEKIAEQTETEEEK